jgi:hypothetical protein
MGFLSPCAPSKNPTVVGDEAYAAKKRRKKQDLGRGRVITFGYRALILLKAKGEASCRAQGSQDK